MKMVCPGKKSRMVGAKAGDVSEIPYSTGGAYAIVFIIQ
jgi:hypothetical protein